MSVFHNGQHEKLKLAVHAAAGLIAVTCLGYNAIAWTYRRSWHLALNTVIYTGVFGFELCKVRHHWRDR